MYSKINKLSANWLPRAFYSTAAFKQAYRSPVVLIDFKPFYFVWANSENNVISSQAKQTHFSKKIKNVKERRDGIQVFHKNISFSWNVNAIGLKRIDT